MRLAASRGWSSTESAHADASELREQTQQCSAPLCFFRTRSAHVEAAARRWPVVGAGNLKRLILFWVHLKHRIPMGTSVVGFL